MVRQQAKNTATLASLLSKASPTKRSLTLGGLPPSSTLHPIMEGLRSLCHSSIPRPKRISFLWISILRLPLTPLARSSPWLLLRSRTSRLLSVVLLTTTRRCSLSLPPRTLRSGGLRTLRTELLTSNLEASLPPNFSTRPQRRSLTRSRKLPSLAPETLPREEPRTCRRQASMSWATSTLRLPVLRIGTTLPAR